MTYTQGVVQVLIIEDERTVADFVDQALREAGYSTGVVGGVVEARQALAQESADLLLLDVMLPDGNGFALVEEIRAASDVPILMLTARDSLEDRVRGLDAGADDYLVKPFRLEELLARVRALLRRRRGEKETVRVGGLVVDLTARQATFDGKPLFLSTTEYSLLEILARHRGELVAKATILSHIWEDEGRDPNLVEVYVNYVRHRLERAGAPRLIHTIRGRGYALSEDPPD